MSEIVNARIVGKPSAESDAAIARKLERFLQGEAPGTTWHLREGREARGATVATAGEVDVRPSGPDDQGAIAA